MSKFKPGDIVYYMDGSTLCQAVVCIEDGCWPLVDLDGKWCVVYNISPDHGTRVWKHHDESQYYCDHVETAKLHKTPEALIGSIKSGLKKEYDKKIKVLDAYNTGSREQKQTLSDKVRAILLGRDVND